MNDNYNEQEYRRLLQEYNEAIKKRDMQIGNGDTTYYDIYDREAQQIAQKIESITSEAISQTSSNINEVSEKINKIIDIFTSFSSSEKSSNQNEQTYIDIDAKIQPIKTELQLIREVTLPQLQESQKTVKEFGIFLTTNERFIKSALEADSVMNTIKSENKSIMKRLESLEDSSNKTKDRRIAVFSVVVAIFSCIVTLISVAIAAYVAFFN